MPTDIKAHLVFIASPGGLDDERAAIRREIAEFNEERLEDTGRVYIAKGWEDVAGQLGRAQSAINPLIETCDYLIMMLADRWGTPPGGSAALTSGTQEEFHLAQQLVASDDAPMKDVLLLFKGLPEDRLRDPGPQLQQVLDFKTEREKAHDVYYKTFDSLEDLRREVRRALQRWTQDGSHTGGQAATVAPAPASADEVPPALPEGATEVAALLASARAYEDHGLITQAEALYARAVADESPEALAAYARFLRRTGRPTKSIAVNERVLRRLAVPNGNDNAGARSEVLTNIGIALRKLNILGDSRQRLSEAVATARTATPPDAQRLAYALDNLGIVMTRMGDYEEAQQKFDEASKIREAPTFTEEERAESLLHLARLSRRIGSLDTAEAMASEVLERLSDERPHRLRAAAYALIGQAKLARRAFAEARAPLQQALSINEALGAPDYIAMCSHDLAKAALGLGETRDAEKYAERALRENRLASNREGELTSLVLLGRAALADGRPRDALPVLQDAVKGHVGSANRYGHGWALRYLADAQGQLGMEQEAESSRARARRLGVF